jgi:hypothetical protein
MEATVDVEMTTAADLITIEYANLLDQSSEKMLINLLQRSSLADLVHLRTPQIVNSWGAVLQ